MREETLHRREYRKETVQDFDLSDVRNFTPPPETAFTGFEHEDIDMDKIDRVMNARRSELRKNCREMCKKCAEFDKRFAEIYFNRQYKLVWCNLGSASRYWYYNMNVLAGYQEAFLKETRRDVGTLMRALYDKPNLSNLRQALLDSTSFLIIRHPFTRILASYVNNIETYSSSFFRQLGNMIIVKYRNSESVLKYPNFDEFVRYLIDSYPYWGEGLWMPVMKSCLPCLVDYKVIIKYENIFEEDLYFLRTQHLEGTLDNYANMRKLDLDDFVVDGALQEYYGQLGEEQIKSLYEIFRYDFELFGYTMDVKINLTSTNFTK